MGHQYRYEDEIMNEIDNNWKILSELYEKILMKK